jgi:energy-converting hydrogenase Eha subunit E
MDALVWIVSFLIIISKFLDCYTTSTRITSLSEEQNPIARKIMKRLGTRLAIWMIFGISIVIVGFSLWVLFVFYNTTLHKILFVLVGAFVALIQFAVSHTNYTRRTNIFTECILRLKNRIEK